MWDLLPTSYLLAPLLGGALLHGLCVRNDWLSFLARPIDRGRTLQSRRLFGENKTFRGPVALAAGTSFLMGLQAETFHDLHSLRALELFDYGQINGWWYGACMGAASMLAELPNSFLKRRLGIAPGHAAEGLLGLVLYFIDQVDLVMGVWIVVAIFTPEAVTTRHVLSSIGIVFIVHQLTNMIGFGLQMRASPR